MKKLLLLPVATVIFLCVISLSSYSMAQGVIEARRCPHAKEGNPDGVHGGSMARFTHESWVDEKSKGNGKYFRRCIENQGDNEVWTHWKGILAASWIPPKNRLYASTYRSNGREDPKDTDLWWGDAQDQQEVIEAKCYEGEESCKRHNASLKGRFIKAQWSQPEDSNIFPGELRRTLNMFGSFNVGSYAEFYVPKSISSSSRMLLKCAVYLKSSLRGDRLNSRLLLNAGYNVGYYVKEYQQQGPVFNIFVQGDYFREFIPERRSSIGALELYKAASVPRFYLPIGQLETQVTNLELIKLKTIAINITDPSGEIITTIPVSALIRR